MSETAGIVVAGIGGLLVGSFLNVVIHRLPRGESLASPGSHCPRCGRPIAPWDNVPVVSWLMLRGRCRHCGEPISPRYPLVEASTAALCAGTVAVRSSAVGIALGILLVLTLVPLALIDLDHRVLPNRIVVPSAVAAIVVGTVLDPGGEPERLIAGAAAGAFFLLFALAYPRGMGMGDVKLAGMLGLYLGRSVAAAVLVALLAGVLIGGVVMRRVGVRAGRKTAVPFGPMLALGGLTGLFVGGSIVSWYLDTFT